MTTGAWTGSTIGAYQLAELVGAGGMGEVYRALHRASGRTVAMKVLTAAAGMPEMTQRFRNEARVQAAMRHPNIAVLYELLDYHGTPCMAMEFVDGEVFDDILRRRGALPVEEALALAAPVVDAVGYIHSRGVIHRDIKAANAKVSSAGVVKLLDFGIAKGPGSPALTRTGNVIGTLQSLAPEQLAHGRSDHLSDIWALGVLIHELLTGVHPFAEQGMLGITDRIRSGRFRLPSRINPLLPTGVDRIVARCLRVEPTQRYQSCEALLTDIRALLEPAPAGASRPGVRHEELLAFARKRGIAGALVLAALLAIAVPWWYGGRPAPAPWGSSELGDTAIGRLRGTGLRGDGAGLLDAASRLELDSVQSGGAAMPLAQTAQHAGTSPVREVTVSAINGTADVYRDGRYMGRTPYILRDSIGTSVSLLLRRTGYEDTRVSFDVTEGRRAYSITLPTEERRPDGADGGAPPVTSGWLGLSLVAWIRRRRGSTSAGHAAGSAGDGAVTGTRGLPGDAAEVPTEAAMIIGISTDVGCLRDVNEDSVRVVRPDGARAMSSRGLLAVVCDGMGGHAAGETASRLAVDAVARFYASSDSDPGISLAMAVRRANRVVFDAARADAHLTGMGTTCTAVVVRGGRAWCAHVGDSRCYLLRGDELYLMTEDHSAVMELVRNRSISRDEARVHPDRNVVSRAIGSHRHVEVSTWPQPFVMRAGDRLLLSSDGLHDLLEEDELRLAALAHSPQDACRQLIALAREHGAPDNVSVIILELPARRPSSVVVRTTRELQAVVGDGGGEASEDASAGANAGASANVGIDASADGEGVPP